MRGNDEAKGAGTLKSNRRRFSFQPDTFQLGNPDP